MWFIVSATPCCYMRSHPLFRGWQFPYSSDPVRVGFVNIRAPTMARRSRIYEGKAKTIFEGPEPGTLVQYFKDDATSLDKHSIISGKGVLNNRISEYLMTRL